ncbi:MAG: GAF domain-containing sensor histidine kinase, partial [Thermoplasmata archaeon]|nr:GAF domain-containing sensor histidine kinase [Thermoplasmata archaeon]
GYDEYDIHSLNLYEDKGVMAWVARNKRSYYVPDVKKEPLYLPGGKDIRCEYATPIIIGDRFFGVLNIEKKEVNSIAEEERNLVDMLAEHMAVALASLEHQEDLQRAKNFQELMVHIMSHDLKNPLAVSTGYVEMLREEYNPEYVEGAHRALEEAFNIIEKVKLFSRLGSGKIDEKKTQLSLRRLIEKASSLILEKYAGTEIVLDMEEMCIEGYPLLDTVFLNIIDNAFKYGATKVAIKGTEFQDCVKISVADDGPGIPEDMKDKIFEPFERLSSKRGSGLGLAIVKMIVQLHGGEVWVENNVPKGSIFIVQLPKS